MESLQELLDKFHKLFFGIVFDEILEEIFNGHPRQVSESLEELSPKLLEILQEKCSKEVLVRFFQI